MASGATSPGSIAPDVLTPAETLEDHVSKMDQHRQFIKT